jgi:chemotaxis protein CheC
MTNIEYDSIRMDSLKEIGNIGVGNATTALSDMINNKTIDLGLPEVVFESVDQILDFIVDQNDNMVVVELPVDGQLKGSSVFIFDSASARKMMDLLTDQKFGSLVEFDEYSLEAFKEMGNVMIGAYLTAIGDMLDFNIRPGLPSLKIDKSNDIKDFVKTRIPGSVSKVLTIKTEMKIQTETIKGGIFLVFDAISMMKLTSKLKNMV